ncbi:NAD-dependent epimerase/dehydratase family protein [Candidatus Pelagibacter ubique]|nr:NAD-dependent epimerase/dehydratase family protein [Candidatus Pelagibacter ubique]
MNKKKNLFLTGHKGLVGSAILRILKKKNYYNIIVVDKSKLDLRDYKKLDIFIKKNKINYLINAAAKVGGIYANDKYKADFILSNLQIQNNIIELSHKHNLKSAILLGSSCIYPKFCKQPIKENYLLSGKLEETNKPYAVAKIAGAILAESFNLQYKTKFKFLMPCNLYGQNDNYNEKYSHFFPSLIRKIYSAKKKKQKKIILWGSGKPLRELMHVDDFAEACLFFLKKKTKETIINIGSGSEMSILSYAKFIMNEMKYKCTVKFDKSKPDGTPRKILNSNIAKKYGWKAKISIKKGFLLTFDHYKNNLIRK